MKRGRPARAVESSTVRVVIYVTESEARALASAGKIAGQTRNEYIRDLVVTEAGDLLEK